MTRYDLTLFCLLSLTLAATAAGNVRAPQAPERRVIEVVARRFAFEPARIEVMQGEPVRLQVRSADGPHGFEVRRFRIARELLRGAPAVTIDFTADEAGQFPILCSLFCGDGHEDMKGMLVVQARETTEP